MMINFASIILGETVPGFYRNSLLMDLDVWGVVLPGNKETKGI